MGFKDVPETKRCYNDVMRVVAAGLMNGYSVDFFGPDDHITRGDFASVLARLTFKLCLLDGRLNTVLPAICTILASGNADGKTKLGTAFYITPDGYLLTAKHVIEAENQFCLVDDGQVSRQAKVVAVNDAHDLALLKVDSSPAPAFLKIAPNNAIYPGKHIAVIGSPRGYNDSITQGVVSHPRREHDMTSGEIDCFQLDAPINEGNSGGVVVDGNGEVIGLVDWKIKLIAVEGMAFAIRCDVMREFLKANRIIV
jgi:S1-C subfamily serine protease